MAQAKEEASAAWSPIDRTLSFKTMAQAKEEAEDPWWQLSPQEKKRIVQDMWAAALIDDLDMGDDEDDDASVSYGVPASKKAMMDLHIPTETREGDDDHGCCCCAVCLEGLGTDGHKLRMMPCHHTFHQLCIFRWLLVNRVCPVCQFALPSNEEQCLQDQEEACPPPAEGTCYQPMILD